MRIHQMLVNELLTQAEFRSAFLEYARERVGEASLLPVSEWPFPDTEAPVPVPVPVATGWRDMVAREIIREGDQWAPLSDPERWRPVGDSVGKQVGQFKRSRFRCPADREVVEGPELTASQPVYVFAPPPGTTTHDLFGPGTTWTPDEVARIQAAAPPPPEPGTSYVRGRIADGLTEYTDVEVRHFPLRGGAILWNGDDVPGPGIVGDPDSMVADAAGQSNCYSGVTRPYLYAVTCGGRRSTAGEGYRILWPDEQLQSGDEYGNDVRGWVREHEVDYASGSLHFAIKVHRRRIEWGSVPVAPRGATCDVVMTDEPIPVAPLPEAPPEPVAQSDAERRRSWRLLEPHEICRGGDRYANPSDQEDWVCTNRGRRQDEIEGCDPVIRPIVTERLDPTGTVHTARPGRRFLDPEETVPSGERWTRYPAGVTDPGVRARDRIIEVLIVEVENA